jgi:hypothetical protein
MKKIEIIFTQGKKQEQLEIQNEQFLIGSAPNCKIKFDDGNQPNIKAVFKRHEDGLFVGVFDPQLKLNVFGQELSQVTFKDSAFFQFADINFVINFTEDEAIADLPPSFEETKMDLQLPPEVKEEKPVAKKVVKTEEPPQAPGHQEISLKSMGSIPGLDLDELKQEETPAQIAKAPNAPAEFPYDTEDEVETKKFQVNEDDLETKKFQVSEDDLETKEIEKPNIPTTEDDIATTEFQKPEFEQDEDIEFAVHSSDALDTAPDLKLPEAPEVPSAPELPTAPQEPTAPKSVAPTDEDLPQAHELPTPQESQKTEILDMDDIVNETSLEEQVSQEIEMPQLPELVENREKTSEIENVQELMTEEEPVKAPVMAKRPRPVVIDGEECHIVFDESHYEVMFDLPVNRGKFDYSNYNDPYEDGPKAKGENIFTDVEEDVLQISHLNNGILLDTDFYSGSSGRVYLSNKKKNRTYFKVHDLPFKKFEFVFVKDGKVYISCPDEYIMTAVVNGELKKVTKETVVLPSNGRIVLSRGTSQIMIEGAKHPPKVAGVEFVEMDERLLKTQGVAYVMALLLLGFVWTFGTIPSITEQKKKEVVVIYKRKLEKKVLKKTEEKKVAKTAATQQTKQKKKKVKKVAKNAPKNKPKKKPKKVTPKKVAKVKPKKLPKKVKKVAKKMAKKVAKKKPTKKVATSKKIAAKKVAVKKKPKKVFNFNIASKMKATVGSSSNSLAKVKSSSTYVTTVSEGAKANRAIASANIEAQGVSTSGFSASEIGTVSNATGARGLAVSKKGTATAYVETTTKVLGAIDPELIRKLLREHIPQFRYCYQAELNSGNENLKGVFDIQFQITGKGKGRKVKLVTKGTKFTKKGVNCIRKVISMITFPKPKGGGVVDVRQPMNFFSNKSNI